MTQDNTMASLELWVKQLQGTLDVQEIARTKPALIPDIAIPYLVFLRPYDKVGLLASTNKRRFTKCNIEFLFDGNTRKLKDVKMINQDDEDGN